MLDYSKVIENSNAFKIILRDAESSRLSHAYLFVSKDKNYLKKFAEKVSKIFINLNDKAYEKRNNERIESRNHPDVLFYGEEKSIDTETAKDIIEKSQVSPFEADKKIFILNSADEMNESSQNKILKSIEEPPQNMFYLLLSTGVSKILPTILSRVKKIELDEIKTSEIESMLTNFGVSKTNAEVYAICSNGDASFAEKLASDSSFIEFYGDIVDCLLKINGSRDVLAFSNKFGAKNVDKNEFFDINLLLLRDLLMILSKKEDMVYSKNVIQKLKMIAGGLNFSAVNVLIETAINSKKDLFFNANGTAVVDNFLFKIAEVKVKCRRL